MKRIIAFILILFIPIILFLGRSVSGDKRTLNITSKENEAILESLESLSNRVRSLELSKETLLTLIDEQVTILSGELDDSYLILPIYHNDIDTFEIRTQYYVMIKSNLSIEEKLKTLSNKLSYYSFDGLPIELVEIKEVEGKKVAVINIIDSEKNANWSFERTWSGNYFQGSSGASVTANKLIKTFLQNQLEGDWIEGVKFLYNYDTTNNFDHMGDFFGNIHY